MKLMFASLDTGPYENIADIAHLTKYFLSSFWYITKKKDQGLYDLMSKRNEEDNFILDSGAFTLMMTENTDLHKDLDEYIERYIAFVKKYKIKRYIEMDIDGVIGYEKVKEIRAYLEKEIGWPSIPVWHKSRGIDEWYKHVEEYDYIAFGGFNDVGNTGVKKSEYDDVKRMVAYANSKGVKVHGLGFTNKDSWQYGFYSVDSSSWTVGRRFGTVVKFQNNQIKVVERPENTRLKDTRLADRHNFIEWCKFQRYVETKGYWKR